MAIDLRSFTVKVPMHITKGAALVSIFFVFVAVCISAFFNFTSRAFDWYYFDSLAVLIRSSILHYGTLPIHDPWACSGTSILANAQNWIFSPSLLFTLLFPANFGNWVSLIVFKLFGFAGMLRFLQSRKIDPVICWLAAAWFVNLNWFSLHFAEGHVVFRGFYLLPWLLLWSDKIESPRQYLKLVGLFGLLILDGGIYPAVFGFLFCIVRLAADREQWKPLAGFFKNHWAVVCLSLVSVTLLLLPKIYPVMVNSENLKSAQEQLELPISLIMHSLFNPTWNNSHVIEGNLRFHEIGNYLGVAAVVIIFALMIGREKIGRAWVFAALAGFFAWISFGTFGDFNPYSIISSVPFVEKLHVQTRYGILLSLSLILMISHWADGKDLKKMFYVLLVLVNIECLVANYFSYFPDGEYYELPMVKRELWNKTIPERHKPIIYYSPDEVSKKCYEPSQVRSFTKSNFDAGYRGEVEGRGEGKLDQLVLTPGQIQFSYVAEAPLSLVINHHFLDGWKSDKYEVRDVEGRIGLSLPAGQGEVVLKYRPLYLNWIIISFIAGVAGFVYLFRRYR